MLPVLPAVKLVLLRPLTEQLACTKMVGACKTLLGTLSLAKALLRLKLAPPGGTSVFVKVTAVVADKGVLGLRLITAAEGAAKL